MRGVLRALAGIVLVAGGVLSLTGGAAAWAVGELRSTGAGIDSEGGAFITNLAPVHADGYVIVVPDVADLLARHGAGRHLGDGRLTITVRSASVAATDLVVVALVRAGEAARYLSGIARTELVAVGYTTGDQPVEVADRFGGAPPGPAPWETADPGQGPVPQGGRVVTVPLDVPTSYPVALVVRRWDNSAGLTALITVGFAPASLGVATAVLFLTGALATVSGLALLMLRRPWIDPQMFEVVQEPPLQPVAARRERPTSQRPTPQRVWEVDPDSVEYWLRTGEAPPVAGELVGVGPSSKPQSPYVYTAT